MGAKQIAAVDPMNSQIHPSLLPVDVTEKAMICKAVKQREENEKSLWRCTLPCESTTEGMAF